MIVIEMENGKKIERKGFIARNKIEKFDSKVILPHEYTMGGPKEDRLKLTKACEANFSQIFLVYSDPKKVIENAKIELSSPSLEKTIISLNEIFGDIFCAQEEHNGAGI